VLPPATYTLPRTTQDALLLRLEREFPAVRQERLLRLVNQTGALMWPSIDRATLFATALMLMGMEEANRVFITPPRAVQMPRTEPCQGLALDSLD
jgi:hypothetical protein